jgi:hypothetical protein
MLVFSGLPDRVGLEGSHLIWTSQTGATVFDVDPKGAPSAAPISL